MCQYGRIKTFYKIKNKLARQRLQNKTGKEEGKEPKETGPQIGNVRMGSVKGENHLQEASSPKD